MAGGEGVADDGDADDAVDGVTIVVAVGGDAAGVVAAAADGDGEKGVVELGVGDADAYDDDPK